MKFNRISIRDIDVDLWRKFRSYCLEHGYTVGKMLNKLISEMLDESKR